MSKKTLVEQNIEAFEAYFGATVREILEKAECSFSDEKCATCKYQDECEALRVDEDWDRVPPFNMP